MILLGLGVLPGLISTATHRCHLGAALETAHRLPADPKAATKVQQPDRALLVDYEKLGIRIAGQTSFAQKRSPVTA